jgi:hypothetical protein
MTSKLIGAVVIVGFIIATVSVVFDRPIGGPSEQTAIAAVKYVAGTTLCVDTQEWDNECVWEAEYDLPDSDWIVTRYSTRKLKSDPDVTHTSVDYFRWNRTLGVRPVSSKN